jgi:hypothetical protein
VSPEIRGSASNKIALATPDPAIPKLLVNYDPAAASANLAACKELVLKHQMKEARALLLPRVFGGIASPEERDMLATLCAALKDATCMGRMEDAGLVMVGMTANLDKADIRPATGGCSACPLPKPKPKP